MLPRGPAKVADDATQPTNTTQAQLRGKAEAEEAVVAKARGFAEQARRTALHAVAPASHPRDGWHCTVYRATRAVGVAQSQTSTATQSPRPHPRSRAPQVVAMQARVTQLEAEAEASSRRKAQLE